MGILADEISRSLYFQGPIGVQGSGGAGLGLYTLAKRVEALAGSYGSSNRTDGIAGSVFWFTIPYFPQSIPRSSEPEERQFESELRNPRQSFTGSELLLLNPGFSSLTKLKSSEPNRILLVEDSLTILKMTAKILEQAGYAVDKATNGSVAVDYATRNYYSLILMDIQLPLMNGIEATKKIREFEKVVNSGTKKTIIIGVSANSNSTFKIDASLSGMDGFIPKPFNMSRLSEVLNLIDSRQDLLSAPTNEEESSKESTILGDCN
jgi:CheY-like chemotaxis protein